jgi:uncharacterized protein
MIAVDTNILIYAHREESTFHDAASACLRELAEGAAAWAIPWPCIHEFYSVCTNTRAFSPASTPTQALNQIEIWRESPTLQVISTSSAHWEVFRELCERGKLQGGIVHDARIAAICIENGIRELWTADRDFSRFKRLKTKNPLV